MNRPLLAALAACCLGLAAAAEPAAPLSLEEALRSAWQRNETADIAGARLDQAAASRRQALAALLPTLSANASIARASRDYHPFGSPTAASAGESLGAGVVLVDPAAWLALEATRSAAAASELEAGELRRALAFSTASAYLQAWAADRQLAAAERRRAVAQRTVDEGTARVAAGMLTAYSQARNELELASAELALTRARLAVRTTRLALAELIVAPPPQAIADLPLCAVPEGDAEALASSARRRRADLRASALRVDAFERTARGRRAGYLPTVGVNGAVSVDEQTRGAYASGEPIWSVSLGATWSLYDGGAGLAQAAAADAQRREEAAGLRAATRKLGIDLASAQATLDAAQVGTIQGAKQVEVARLNQADVDARAAQGLATGLQAADASASLFEAEQALITAQLTLEASRYELRRLVGWWPLEEGPPAAPAPPR